MLHNRVNTAESHTLDSGIDGPPGINVAPPLKKFHIIILIHFYINQGIAAIFKFFFLFFFPKINKRSPTFIPDSRVDYILQK